MFKSISGIFSKLAGNNTNLTQTNELNKDAAPCTSTCCSGASSASSFKIKSIKPFIREVQIFGSGCKKCKTLYQNANKALEELNLNIKAQYITDFNIIGELGIITLPEIRVNNTPLAQGRLLTAAEIKELIIKNYNIAQDRENINDSLTADTDTNTNPQTTIHQKPKVAFVCVHNSCRSQIAEALGKILGSEYFESYSGGTEIKDNINPKAITFIKELYNYDMEKEHHHPKLLSDLPKDLDIVITMGCNVKCPNINAKEHFDWGLADRLPKDNDEAFKEGIKNIAQKVEDLISYIKNNTKK